MEKNPRRMLSLNMEGKKRIEKEEEENVEINPLKNFDVEAPSIPGREEEKEEEKDATMIKKKTPLRYSSYAEKGIESSTRSVERVSIKDMEAIKIKEKEIKSSVQNLVVMPGAYAVKEIESTTDSEEECNKTTEPQNGENTKLRCTRPERRTASQSGKNTKLKPKVRLAYTEDVPAPERRTASQSGKDMKLKRKVRLAYTEDVPAPERRTEFQSGKDMKLKRKVRLAYTEDVPAPERRTESQSGKNMKLKRKEMPAYSEDVPAPKGRGKKQNKKESLGNDDPPTKNQTDNTVKMQLFKCTAPEYDLKKNQEESAILLEAELAPDVDEVVNRALQQAMAGRDEAIDLALKNMTTGAVIVRAEKIDNSASNRFPRRCIILVCIVIVFSIIALGLYFGLRDKENPIDPTEAPPPPLSMNRFDSLKLIIGKFYSNKEEETVSFPSSLDQERALIWLSKTDPKELSVNSLPSTLLDRYFAALLYFSLSGSSWSKRDFWLSENSICFWEGLGCNNQNRLSKIDMSNIGINGTIPTDFGLITNLELLHLKNDENNLNSFQTKTKTSTLKKSSSSNNNGKYHNIESRITNGTVTAVGDYPFFAFLSSSYDIRCAGTLIHEDLILSSTACYSSDRVTSATLGLHELNKATEGVEYRSVIEAYNHPNYEAFEYDFSVMKLDKSVTTITPVQLNRNLPSDNDQVTIMGFGRTSPESFSQFLREANANVLPYETCKSRIPGYFVDDIMICIGSGGGNACSGDQGAPLLTQSGEQAGLLAFSSGACGSSQRLDVYSSVSSVTDWIDDMICEHSENPPLSCTFRPTISPTISPSSIPTRQPSSIPTRQPSSAPSQGPKPHLFGTIPIEIGSLTKLQSLDLSNNGLTGSIPMELGMLTELMYLSLSNNKLSGSIPAELQSILNKTITDADE